MILRRITVLLAAVALFDLLLITIIKNKPGVLDSFTSIPQKISTLIQENYLILLPNQPSPKEALESDTPLPKKVKDSFASVVSITSQMKFNSQFTPSSPGKPSSSGGTAFLATNGYFISARHVFFSSIANLRNVGFPFTIDKQGLPLPGTYKDGTPFYSYAFYGTANSNGASLNFPLELVSMGKLDNFQDFAAFKSNNPPPEIKPLEFEENVTLGETLYNAGQVPLTIEVEGTDPNPKKETLFDTLRYSFSGPVVGIITDMPINDLGIKKMYRLRINCEYGFSGGPIFNKDGKVVALTILRVNNFSYAISATDLKLFIKNIK